MSSWWTAQKVLKQALRASGRGNGFVFVVFAFPVLLVLIALIAGIVQKGAEAQVALFR